MDDAFLDDRAFLICELPSRYAVDIEAASRSGLRRQELEDPSIATGELGAEGSSTVSRMPVSHDKKIPRFDGDIALHEPRSRLKIGPRLGRFGVTGQGLALGKVETQLRSRAMLDWSRGQDWSAWRTGSAGRTSTACQGSR